MSWTGGSILLLRPFCGRKINEFQLKLACPPDAADTKHEKERQRPKTNYGVLVFPLYLKP